MHAGAQALPPSSMPTARILAQLVGFHFNDRHNLARSMKTKAHAKRSFAVVDIETTGFRPPVAAITEIGAVTVERGRVGRSFQTLVDPGRPIPPFIERLTGISSEMVAGQPSIEEVLPALAEFLGNRVAVAHNAAFDFSFLDYEARRLWGRPLPQPRLCTVKLARSALPQIRSRSLDSLLSLLRLRCKDRHRALGDAEATAKLLLVLLRRLRTRRDQVLDHLIQPPKTHRRGNGRFSVNYYR